MSTRSAGLRSALGLASTLCFCCQLCLALNPTAQQEAHSMRPKPQGSGSRSSRSSSSSAMPKGGSCTVILPKQDCGYFGIQQAECESKPCCWQPMGEGSTTPWCYYPQAPTGPTYTVAERRDTDDWTTELLLQLAQPILPQYGPDYEQLSVLVEAQTPQRVHVKISPTGDSTRWQVPEFLIPRPGGMKFDSTAARL
eukprot:GHUV01022586.1.p1 GENE.GHUV01022586.1~~GHUV01022586.1.p1  ORF type:complete len:196 (+),score=41.55 GHUV01022586.1:353-940(+)